MVTLVMAWSPARRVNAGRFEVDHPGDYATFNSNRIPDGTNEVTRLALYSEISEAQYNESTKKHKGSMTIPYINLPASGEFNMDKRRATQVRQLLGITFDKETTNTLISRGLSAIGVAAYVACLDAQRVIIDLPGYSPDDQKFFATIKWHPEGGEEGELKNLQAINASVLDAPALPTKMKPNETVSSLVDRPRLDKSFKLLARINGFTAVIALPAQERFTLTPENFTSDEVAQNADNSNGHGHHTNAQCIDAPAQAQFLYGSAKPLPRLVVGCGQDPNNPNPNATGFTITSQDEYQVCVLASANDCNARGAFAAGRITARILKKTPR